jgi:hypothetical protein
MGGAMIHRPRASLPTTPWSPPFVLFLVVAMVQIYLLIFLRLVSLPALAGDFLAHQWLYNFLTAGGSLARALPFELMKINLLLAVYLWAMSRTMDPRRKAVQRLSLLGAAVLLVVLQLAWAGSYEVVRPRFDLVPVSLSAGGVVP